MSRWSALRDETGLPFFFYSDGSVLTRPGVTSHYQLLTGLKVANVAAWSERHHPRSGRVCLRRGSLHLLALTKPLSADSIGGEAEDPESNPVVISRCLAALEAELRRVGAY
jgi:hypothetical protein